MKKAVCIIFVNILLVGFSFGQNPQTDEFQIFANQISRDSSFNEIKNTLSLAQKAFQAKVKNIDRKQTEYADFLLKFANVRKKAFNVLRLKLYSDNSSTAKEKLVFLDFHHQNGTELFELLKDAVNIYEKSGVENLQRAHACFEFGWLNDEYSPPEKRPRTLSEKNESIKKTQEMYAKAFELREKLLGNSDEATLVTMNFLADSYVKRGNFEQALPIYEKFLLLTEKKYGRKFEPLLPALRAYRSLLWMLGRQEETSAVEKHISEITGENKDLPISLLDLSFRAKNLNYKGLNEMPGNVRVNLDVKSLLAAAGRLEVVGENKEMRTAPKVRVLEAENSRPGINIVRANIVRVVVDENGKVIEAKAENTDEKTAKRIEEIVMKWEFVPFSFEGAARKMNGFIYYKEEK